MENERSPSPLLRKTKKSGVQFLFQNHWLFIIVALILMGYNAYTGVQKAKGYIHWQKGQLIVAKRDWSRGIDYYEKAINVLPDNG